MSDDKQNKRVSNGYLFGPKLNKNLTKDQTAFIKQKSIASCRNANPIKDRNPSDNDTTTNISKPNDCKRKYGSVMIANRKMSTSLSRQILSNVIHQSKVNSTMAVDDKKNTSEVSNKTKF